MSKQGPHLGAGGWFISRMYRHSPSDSNNVIITGVTASHTHTPRGRLFPISLSRCGMWPIIRWGFCLSEGFVVAVVQGKAAVSLWASCAWVCSQPWSTAPQRRKAQPWHQETQTSGWSGPPLDYSGQALFLRKHTDMDYCLNVKCPFVGDIWLIIS